MDGRTREIREARTVRVPVFEYLCFVDEISLPHSKSESYVPGHCPNCETEAGTAGESIADLRNCGQAQGSGQYVVALKQADGCSSGCHGEGRLDGCQSERQVRTARAVTATCVRATTAIE